MSDLEMKIEDIKKSNKLLLNQFQKSLENAGLAKSTTDKHVDNMEFYINEFLLYAEPQLPKEGYHQIDNFLGNWFIKKAMWASVPSIKENITSIKKFYQFMYEIEEISYESLTELKEDIKERKSYWIETLQKYDNPDIDIEDVW